MISNAKIGLLLGLVVIFVFVFIINGLSGFGNARDDDDLSRIVIADPTGIKPDIQPGVFSSRRVPERLPEETSPPEDKDRFRGQPQRATPHNEVDNFSEPVKQTWPKVHIVCKGDNLAEIAKKFYGPKEGNRRANIKRLFKANSKLLESPDDIYPGQKLIIPSLWTSNTDHSIVEGIFPSSMFEKVESIGRRHL